MNSARFRPKLASAPRFLNTRLRPSALILAAFVLAPALAIFCYHLTVSPVEPQPLQAGAEDLALAPRAALPDQQPGIYDALKPVRNPRFGEVAESPVEDPFEAAVSRAMLTAQGDPFLYAMALGNAEGELSIRRMNGNIPVFGPPAPSLRTSGYSDKEILRMMQSGIGGSFGNFFSHMFGERPGGIDGDFGTGRRAGRKPVPARARVAGRRFALRPRPRRKPRPPRPRRPRRPKPPQRRLPPRKRPLPRSQPRGRVGP